jgi:hypothetical protein
LQALHGLAVTFLDLCLNDAEVSLICRRKPRESQRRRAGDKTFDEGSSVNGLGPSQCRPGPDSEILFMLSGNRTVGHAAAGKKLNAVTRLVQYFHVRLLIE